MLQLRLVAITEDPAFQGNRVDYIKVFDTRGVLMHEYFDVKNRFIDLPLSGSSNGIYLIKIKRGDKILTRKVLENLSE